MATSSTNRSEQFFKRIGELTKVQRILIFIVSFVLIGGLYYFFIFQSKNEALQKERDEYKAQTELLETTKKRAAQLTKYEKLMKEAQERFNIAIQALPDKREVASLLTAISNAGTTAGLRFLNFQPKPDIKKDFYIEIPISIQLEGRYHQITDFFFQVAQLNRIVNLNDISIKAGKQGADSLEMSCTAVTYMFFEQSEQDKPDPGKKRRKKR